MQVEGDNVERQLAKDSLPPAILIAGQEPLLVLEAADKVRAKARAEGYVRETFDVEARFDWDTLFASFSEMSLFASRRLLDVRMPSGKPGKEGSEVFTKYCADPPPDTVLMVSCLEWNKQQGNAAWVRAIGQVGIVGTFWSMQRHKLPDWLLARMRARGLDVRHDAAQLLADRVEGNLLAAAQEVDKLVLQVGVPPGEQGRGPGTRASARTIDAAEMDALVADSSRFDVFKLIDSALAGEASRALKMLRSLRAEGDVVPALMGPIVGPLVAMTSLARVKASGGNLSAEMRARQIWDSKQPLYKRALERHDALQWERFAIEAGRIDRISKGRAEGDEWLALERLLAAVAQPRARRLLA